jgi:tRNA(adenine34) deaminase
MIEQNSGVIGERIEIGKTHQDITFHAEMKAIRNATEHTGQQDLSGCILYTNDEPCMKGSYMIRHTNIAVIVRGIATGEIGRFSSELPLLLVYFNGL